MGKRKYYKKFISSKTLVDIIGYEGDINLDERDDRASVRVMLKPVGRHQRN